MNKVYVSSCKDYDINILESIIEKQCKAMGFDEIIKDNCSVMIKPNLIMRRHPDEATTTHPAVVAAVARALKKRGARKIMVGESSGGPYTTTLLRSVYNGTGFTKMAQEEGIELNLDTSYRTVKLPTAKRCKEFNVITPYFEADVIIDIPKLKTHGMTGYSGAVKNLFGLVPGLMKPELHFRFPGKTEFGEMLVDLCEFAKPHFCFADAIICMEGDGPTGGNPRFVGGIISGKSPYAVDIAGCKLLSIEPSEIIMLNDAMKRGVCPKDISEIEILGDDIESLVVSDFKKAKSSTNDFVEKLPRFIQKPAEKILRPKPVIKQNCIGCGKCAESCPQHIIKITNKKAQIEYSDCIRCFCCHEMCPVRAIDIKRFSVLKW